VYQASAVLEIGIDYSRTEPLLDLTAEQAFDRVRGLLLSDETLQAAIDRSGLEGVGVPQFRSRIRLGQQQSGWELMTFGEDPNEVAGLANAWAAVGVERIQDSMVHAIRAAQWQDVLYEASCELRPDENTPEFAVWICHSARPEDDPDEIPLALLEEASLSHGILPIFTYSWLSQAHVPRQPIRWARAGLVLGGMAMGWLGGLAWAVARPFAPPIAGPGPNPRRCRGASAAGSFGQKPARRRGR
jgi:hypothetical protein